MRFVRDIPKEDPALSARLEASGMKRLHEPKSAGAAILLSMPIAFAMGLIEVVFLLWLEPDLFSGFENGGISVAIDLRIFAGLFGLRAFALLHEVIHALFMPKPFESGVYIGFRSGFAFCGMDGTISRGRFLLISFAPLVAISVLLSILFSRVFGIGLYFALVFVVNAMGSCVDLLNAIMILSQTKRGQRLVLNGSATFFG